MSSEARPRTRPIVNPEYLDAALRRLVNACRNDHSDAFAALDAAERLLGIAAPRVVEGRTVGESQ